MANYKESNISGTKWVRSNVIIIQNPEEIDGKGIIFQEEEKMVLGDGTTISNPYGPGLRAKFNPSNQIEMLDPATGLPTGQYVSEYVVYQALFSKYFAMAVQRDLENA